MNVYVWRSLQRITSRYHSGGGIVVFADSEEEARNIAYAKIQAMQKAQGIPDIDRAQCGIGENEHPDEARSCASGKKLVFIMPDAGCC